MTDRTTRPSRRAALALPWVAVLPRLARAQGAWPTQPVRLILPYAAGGPTDVIARLIADALSQRLPQRVVVENRTGAGGNIGASAVAKSRPDGATLLFSNTGHAVNKALYARLDYDPATDLVPVTIVAESPMVMLVPPHSPDRSVADFVARLRASGGRMTYASTGTGGALQLVTLLFLKAAGARMEEIPYRGAAPAAQDLIAGRVDLLYDAGFTAFPLATSGQARALAISAAQRSPVMPDVPTVGEAGFPEATFSVWQAILAPGGTPTPLLARIRAEIAAVLADGPLRARLVEMGAERIIANTPEEARRYVDAEIARWTAVLREAGVQPQ
ncbi:Bug family tripartite tricarboxylate transporter substrate binding protein [Muricoccus radiodurans]|uniref:Bug family tripartite tricarboxylate transporter substrate binding protein n=1 Tax=Muricoccus radiodurans TaxID=2231721 RepID=UPI003CF87329